MPDVTGDIDATLTSFESTDSSQMRVGEVGVLDATIQPFNSENFFDHVPPTPDPSGIRKRKSIALFNKLSF